MALMVFSLVARPALAQDDGEYFEGDTYPGDEAGEEEGYFYVEEGDDASAEAPREEVDISYFFDKLAPHGEWIWTPEHGWVWHPRGVWADWRPYTYGQWVYTEHGWTWSSYFPWGWAAFHYGTWAYLDYIGWVWVPGTVWAPAWVMWRYSNAYIGWAPIMAGYDLWWGWAYYPVYYDHWTFIGWGHFHHSHPHHHYVSRRGVYDAFRHTYFPRRCRSRSGAACHRGPSRKIVGKHVKAPIPVKKIENVKLRPEMLRARKNPLGLKKDVMKVHRPRFKKGPQRMELGHRAPAGVRRTKDLGIIPGSSGSRARTPRPAVRGKPQVDGRRPGSVSERRRPMPGRFIHPRQPSAKPPAVRQPSPRVRSGTDKPGFRRSRPAPGITRPPRAPIRSTPKVRTSPGKTSPRSVPRVKTPRIRSTPTRSTPKVKSSPSKSRGSSYSAPRSRSSSSSRSRSSPSRSRSSGSRSRRR
jgi:hypothetical protein